VAKARAAEAAAREDDGEDAEEEAEEPAEPAPALEEPEAEPIMEEAAEAPRCGWLPGACRGRSVSSRGVEALPAVDIEMLDAMPSPPARTHRV